MSSGEALLLLPARHCERAATRVGGSGRRAAGGESRDDTAGTGRGFRAADGREVAAGTATIEGMRVGLKARPVRERGRQCGVTRNAARVIRLILLTRYSRTLSRRRRFRGHRRSWSSGGSRHGQSR